MIPERRLIAQLRRRSKFRNREVPVGIGDDCAVLHLTGGREALVTTDFSLEGVHFRRDWQSPQCTGHRCLVRGLSDIAAMGGKPMAAFLSLAVPAELPPKWLNRFIEGLLRLATRSQVELAGGDTAQSPGRVLADIMVVGSVPPRTALLRSGARVGDQIYVTGELGESAAAFRLLTLGKIKQRDIYPIPRIAVGEWLRANRVASAAIDISDGLSTDLSHICEESRVGAVIAAERLPIHRAARAVEKAERRPGSIAGLALELALHGGDDYELLFTAPSSKPVPGRIRGVRVTKIGEIVRGSRMRIVRDGKESALRAKGWEHFRRA